MKDSSRSRWSLLLIPANVTPGLGQVITVVVAVPPDTCFYLSRLASCDPDVMETVYDAAGGAEGLLRLADAWHTRVMADDVVSHAFSHGFHPEHSARLAAYWGEALGGPSTFSTEYGHETSVVRIHSGNGQHDEMDRRAITCFDQALTDAGLDDDDRLRQVLHDYFSWATTTTMARYQQSADDVPDGLPIPHWSWTGLVSAS